MTPMPLLLLAAAAVGVDTGWTKLDSGGYEYIIQIPPEQLDALRAGSEFGSDLPADTGAIRSYRIVVGTGPLVNQGVPLPPEARVTFKPIVEDAAAKDNKAKESVVQKPPVGEQKSGGAAGSATGARDQQLSPVDVFRAVRGAPPGSAPTSGANQRPTDEELADDRLVGFGNRQTARDDPEPPSGETTQVEQTKDDEAKATEAGSPSDGTENTASNDPQDELAKARKDMAQLSFERNAVIILLFGFVALIGYLSWWTFDFRNRYLELLRDLDTQPTEQPADEASRRRDEEESANEDESPRELARTAHTYGGRKENQRRRDREQERYDEE